MSGSVRDTDVIIAGVLITIAVVMCTIFITITTVVILKKYCVMEVDATSSIGVTLQSDQKYSKCMKIIKYQSGPIASPHDQRRQVDGKLPWMALIDIANVTLP